MTRPITSAEEGARAEAIELLDRFGKLTMEDALRAAVGAEMRARAAEASASALAERVAVLEAALSSAEEDLYEVANRLGCYVDAMTPQREFEFILSVEKQAAHFGGKIRAALKGASDV